MKKILLTLLVFLMSFGLFGCAKNEVEKHNDKIYSIYLKAKDDGFTGTYEEWLETIKGEDGEDGNNGLSAYDLYLKEHPDYKGSHEEWLDDLVNDRLADDYLLHAKNVKLVAPDDCVTKKDLKTYYFTNGNVPYVGVKELLSTFSKMLPYRINFTDATDDKLFELTYSVEETKYTMVIDFNKDIISVTSPDFLTYLFTLKEENVDFPLKRESRKVRNDKEVVFDLGKYGIDLIPYEEDILLQADVLGNLLFSYSLISLPYNGDEFHLVLGYPNQESVISFRPSSKNGNFIPDDLKIANMNGLYFIMDYFYGLNNYRKGEAFSKIVNESEDLYRTLYNSNPEYLAEGYKGLFLTLLDDLHTSLVSKSVYSDYKDHGFGDITKNMGPNSQEYIKKDDAYHEAYLNKFPDYSFDESELTEKPLRYEGSTAFIKFNSFTHGSGSLIYNDDDTVKDDAWKYNSFFLVKQCLDDIRAYNKANANKIENVVIDLSTNAGGTIATMQEVIGLMTNEDVVCPTTNYQSGADIIETYKVDADLDDDFTDDDAYTEFDFTLLVSPLSFSAGNYMPAIVKDMGIADIIGIQTGGGMCSVGSIALLDGTQVKISSHNILRSSKLDANGNFTEIETGVTPDYVLPFDKFYDLAYLDQLINSSNNA